MSIPPILGVLSTIVVLIVAGVSVVAFTRASYAKATIDALRGDISDRNERIEFLDGENTRMTDAITRLDRENKMLRDLMTNRAELAEYIAVAREHELKADLRHGDMLAVDEQIMTGIEELRRLVAAR